MCVCVNPLNPWGAARIGLASKYVYLHIDVCVRDWRFTFGAQNWLVALN